MRFLILILFAGVQVQAQPALFPLHIGDRWQYIYLPPPAAPPLGPSVRVVSDTVMPGGSTFAVLPGNDFMSSEYVRQHGDSVFVYSPSLKHDYLYLDFSRHPGDTVSSITMGSDTMDIVLQGVTSTSIFGGSLREWWFGVNLRHAIDDEFGLAVVDSVGMIEKHVTFGDTYNLQGAVINGRVYGMIDALGPVSQILPEQFEISQNFPNPFNPSTTIRSGLPTRAHVTLSVFNILGQQVASLVNESQEAGYHDVRFDGSRLASGIYFYRIQAGNFVQTRKLLLVR